MSVSERSSVTVEQVQAELTELETAYKAARKKALDRVTKPYQERRRKLTRLIDVLSDEKPRGKPAEPK